MRLDASPKIQIILSYASTLCWAMVHERCAWSGGEGKHIVKGVLWIVQRLVVERRRVRMVMSSSCRNSLRLTALGICRSLALLTLVKRFTNDVCLAAQAGTLAVPPPIILTEKG